MASPSSHSEKLQQEIVRLNQMMSNQVPLINSCPLCFEQLPIHAAYPHLVYCLPKVSKFRTYFGQYAATWNLTYSCPNCSPTNCSPVVQPAPITGGTPAKRKRASETPPSTFRSQVPKGQMCDLGADLCDPEHRTASRKNVVVTYSDTHCVEVSF
jgi:hypothetical protein